VLVSCGATPGRWVEPRRQLRRRRRARLGGDARTPCRMPPVRPGGSRASQAPPHPGA
jgi:hypothetical protein